MAWTSTETNVYDIELYSTAGELVQLTQTQIKPKTYYKISNMQGRYNMHYFELQKSICKSSIDMKILRHLLELADRDNTIVVAHMGDFAKFLDTSIRTIQRLIVRALDTGVLHKLSTNKYLLNPYYIMSPSLTASGLLAQETAQANWLNITNLATDTDLNSLLELTKFLELSKSLPVTSFTVDIARYFERHGRISDKQHQALLKFI